uniref:Uncharacterized protein n=1 Tax=Pipistrellus kuhlii TaxID=59472 RepID=A0A7J7UGF3_PIPKU|nr:hypothetical protein mPipKuh1_009070 [Pipistrellus kuhlii]
MGRRLSSGGLRSQSLFSARTAHSERSRYAGMNFGMGVTPHPEGRATDATWGSLQGPPPLPLQGLLCASDLLLRRLGEAWEALSGGNRARELEKWAGLAWEQAELWPRVRQLDPSPGLATAHPSLGSLWLPFYFLNIFLLISGRKGEEERGRNINKREHHRLTASCRPPTGD